MRLNQGMDRRLAAIEGKVIPPKTRTVTVWRDGCGEDKSEQIIAEMRADGRLTEQDRLIICSWGPPAGGSRNPLSAADAVKASAALVARCRRNPVNLVRMRSPLAIISWIISFSIAAAKVCPTSSAIPKSCTFLWNGSLPQGLVSRRISLRHWRTTDAALACFNLYRSASRI